MMPTSSVFRATAEGIPCVCWWCLTVDNQVNYPTESEERCTFSEWMCNFHSACARQNRSLSPMRSVLKVWANPLIRFTTVSRWSSSPLFNGNNGQPVIGYGCMIILRRKLPKNSCHIVDSDKNILIGYKYNETGELTECRILIVNYPKID